MKESLQNFYLFLKKPSLIKQSKDKKLLATDFTALFIIDFTFTVLLFSVFGILLHFDIIKEYEGIDIFKEYGALGTLFIACIIAPVLEETIFRYHLRDLNGAIYFIFISIGILIISQIDGIGSQFATIVLALVIAVSVIEFLKKKGRFYSAKFWKKTYPFLFYYTSFIFGLVHLSNYNGLTVSDPSFVFYIASQTVGGLGLGYLRIKYGLVYSMLFHAFFNLVWVLFAILFP
ncbi:CAAX amino terminal protease self- immunity [compost metagenome]